MRDRDPQARRRLHGDRRADGDRARRGGLRAATTSASASPSSSRAPFKLKAELATAQAVVAGQGQTVRVAGVRIGDLGGVTLKNGRAIVSMDIDDQYKHLIHTDATALLRPEDRPEGHVPGGQPGHQHARRSPSANWTMPVRNTLPDINPDEIFSVLDADTRDYLKLLVNGAGRGLQGRGNDLQDVFRRFEPTHRDLARVSSAVATRRSNLRRLINSLNLPQRRAGLAPHRRLPADLHLVHRVPRVRVRGREHQPRRRRLPGRAAADHDHARQGPDLRERARPDRGQLRPAVRALNTANHAIIPFARETTPILRTQIRPFVRDARPVVRDLRPRRRTWPRPRRT